MGQRAANRAAPSMNRPRRVANRAAAGRASGHQSYGRGVGGRRAWGASGRPTGGGRAAAGCGEAKRMLGFLSGEENSSSFFFFKKTASAWYNFSRFKDFLFFEGYLDIFHVFGLGTDARNYSSTQKRMQLSIPEKSNISKFNQIYI